MNRRSAMLVAAGLIFTLIVGGIALAIGLTGPTSSAAAQPRMHLKAKRDKPRVRTVRRTVKVHRQAPAPAAVIVAFGSSGSAAGSDDTSSGGKGSSGDGTSDDHGSTGSHEGGDHHTGGSGGSDESDDDGTGDDHGGSDEGGEDGGGSDDGVVDEGGDD